MSGEVRRFEVCETQTLATKKKSSQRDDVFCTNYEKAIT